MTELLPYPFCGEPQVIEKYTSTQPFKISCQCDAGPMVTAKTREKCFAKWNSRASLSDATQGWQEEERKIRALVGAKRDFRPLSEYMEEWLENIFKDNQEWEPIETAPDNEWVLIYPSFYKGQTCEVSKQSKSFSNKWLLRDDGRYRLRPTHWQPLPKPPANLTKEPTK